jgi:hypothetical protein
MTSGMIYDCHSLTDAVKGFAYVYTLSARHDEHNILIVVANQRNVSFVSFFLAY